MNIWTWNCCLWFYLLIHITYTIYYYTRLALISLHAISFTRPCMSICHNCYIKSIHKFLHKSINMQILKHCWIWFICIVYCIYLKLFFIVIDIQYYTGWLPIVLDWTHYCLFLTLRWRFYFYADFYCGVFYCRHCMFWDVFIFYILSL